MLMRRLLPKRESLFSPKKKQGSINKKSLNVGVELYNTGTVWAVRNGNLTSVVRWTEVGPIRRHISGPLTDGEDQLIVNQFFGLGSLWDLSHISVQLSDHILKVVKSILDNRSHKLMIPSVGKGMLLAFLVSSQE